MPRERRPRQAAINRSTNQSAYGSRTSRITRATARRERLSENSDSTPTSISVSGLEFSQLFPKFHSQNQDVTMVNGRAMAKKLSSYIAAALNNGQKSLSVKMSNFSDLYSLVKEMVEHDIQPGVYEVVSDCIYKNFGAFVKNCRLTSDLSSTVNLASLQSRMDFHSTFFGKILPYLAAALAFAERRAMLNPVKPVLLSELCCRAFLKCFLSQEGVKQYISDLIVTFFTRMRNNYTEEILAKASTQVQQDDSYKLYMMTWGSQLHSASLVANLIKMLISLDQAKLSVFYNLVLLPLVKRSINYGQALASEHLLKQQQQLGKTMNDYLRWLTNYLQTDRFMLENLFNFPGKSAERMSAILCHMMGTLQMDAFIIGHPTSGFKALLAKELFQEVTVMHSLLEGLYEQTKQAALFVYVNQSIKQHFEHFQRVFYAKHHLITRNDQIAFVQDLLMLKHKWDGVLKEVFPHRPDSDDNKAVMKQFKQIDHIVVKFFFSTLQMEEAVPQALAFYMHSLMLVKSCPSNNKDSKPSLQELNRQYLSSACLPSLAVKLAKSPMSASQKERFAALYHLLSLLQYLQDANSFFEYCKYFFSVRLLMNSSEKNGGGSNTSNTNCIFSLSQELAYFDLLISEIKRVFSISNAVNGEFLHKQITQNLGDFQAISKSWINSEKSYKSFLYALQQQQQHQQAQPVVDSFRIANLGTWKLSPLERCQMPASVEAYFKEVEVLYQAGHRGRRLVLNTAAGRATISAHFWHFKNAQPLSFTVSLHQLAILEQFNARNCGGTFSYDQLLKGGRFLVENNAKLAILSLVYCGLLKVITLADALPQLKFEVEDSQYFYNANKELATGGKTKDLSTFEQVSFWSGNGNTIDLKTSKLMAALGVSNVDIHLELAKVAVEDVNAKCSIILRPQQNQPSAPSSAVQHSHAIPDTALDRQVKIEAAIVRVVKQARHFKSMPELFQAIKETLFTTSKANFPPTDRLTVEEVSTIVVGLIDKKFIKRTPNGGFEYSL